MNKRIYGFDIARALAILGMMLVNYKIIFTHEVIKYDVLNKLLSLFEGRAVAVFLLLAGIGISLMTKKAFTTGDKYLKRKGRITLIKRAIFLFVLGIILYRYFDWSADILHYYGIYLLLVCFFIYMKSKDIIISIVILLIVSTTMQINLDYFYGWNEFFTEYLNFFTISGFLRNTFFNGYHSVFPWFSFILTGVIFGRINFNDLNKIKKITKYSLLLAFWIEIVSASIIILFKNSEIVIYFFDTKPINPTVFYVIASSFWAIGFICICYIFSTKYNNNLTKSLILTGQMALTHYIGHSIVVLSFFEVYDGISYRSEIFVLLFSLIIFALMIIFSILWSKKFKRGPIEMFMRKIT